ARSACFEQLVEHELGHALGLIDSPDGGGVMSPSLDCDSVPLGSARPMFVPLTAGASRPTQASSHDIASNATACAGGCQIATRAAIPTASNGPTNLTYTLVGSTLTLNWTAPVINDELLETLNYNVQAGSAPGLTDIANVFTNTLDTNFAA